MNYYFPLYYGYNRDLLKNQYPGGYTPPVLYDYAYDVHAYLPFVSAPINLSILKDMGTDQLNGSYWVSSAGVPVLANVYADMPLLVSKGTRTKSGDTDTSTYMITDERSSYSFHFGSPAYIGFALGKTGTALAAWCKEEFPRLKSVAIAAESSGDGFRSTSSTYSSSISASWDTRIYVGSCNGSIGSLTADYTVDDIVYNKTSGLSDQSLGEKYKYPFVFVQQDPVYSKQKRLPDVPPNEDYNVYTGVNIFHNAALVGLSPNPLDRDNYVADGWVWNSTFTQVESKSPKSRIISKLQRPFRALDWVQPSNLFYDYIVEPEYISGCQSTSRLERTHSDFESAGDFIFATESVAYSGHRGDQCLCTINGEKGYTKKYKSYARYGFLIPGFCYTGVNISYVKYLKQLGFETGDLVFPPIDDL
jgi:hypothetical protein